MKITINSSELLKALTITHTALNPKPSQAALACTIVEAKAGVVRIYTFALDQGCIVSLDTSSVEITEEGLVCVPSESFLKFAKIIHEDITLTALEDFVLGLKTSKGSYTIQGINPLEFPELPVLQVAQCFDVSACQLKTGLAKTSGTAAKKEYSGGSTAVFITVTDYCIEFFATDGSKAIKHTPKYTCQGSTTGGEVRARIPQRTVALLKKILQEQKEDFTFYLSSAVASPQRSSYASYDFIVSGNITVFYLTPEGRDFTSIFSKRYPKEFTSVIKKEVAVKTLNRIKVFCPTEKCAFFSIGAEGNTLEISKESYESYRDEKAEEWRQRLELRATEFLPITSSEGTLKARTKVKVDDLLTALRTFSSSAKDETVKLTLGAIDGINLAILENQDTQYLIAQKQ